MKRKKINKYQRVINAELDLHGYTTKEAEELLREFFQEAKESNWQRVRIVVGKGIHSLNGKSILGDFVRDFLFSKGIRYSEAKITEGGSGALEVDLG